MALAELADLALPTRWWWDGDRLVTAAAAAIVVTDTARSFDTAAALNEGFLDNHELDVELRPIEAAAAASAAAAVKVETMPAGQACHSGSKLQKPAKNLILKIREID